MKELHKLTTTKELQTLKASDTDIIFRKGTKDMPLNEALLHSGFELPFSNIPTALMNNHSRKDNLKTSEGYDLSTIKTFDEFKHLRVKDTNFKIEVGTDSEKYKRIIRLPLYLMTPFLNAESFLLLGAKVTINVKGAENLKAYTIHPSALGMFQRFDVETRGKDFDTAYYKGVKSNVVRPNLEMVDNPKYHVNVDSIFTQYSLTEGTTLVQDDGIYYVNNLLSAGNHELLLNSNVTELPQCIIANGHTGNVFTEMLHGELVHDHTFMGDDKKMYTGIALILTPNKHPEYEERLNALKDLLLNGVLNSPLDKVVELFYQILTAAPDFYKHEIIGKMGLSKNDWPSHKDGNFNQPPMRFWETKHIQDFSNSGFDAPFMDISTKNRHQFSDSTGNLDYQTNLSEVMYLMHDRLHGLQLDFGEVSRFTPEDKIIAYLSGEDVKLNFTERHIMHIFNLLSDASDKDRVMFLHSYMKYIHIRGIKYLTTSIFGPDSNSTIKPYTNGLNGVKI